jgi:hypothetical protein
LPPSLARRPRPDWQRRGCAGAVWASVSASVSGPGEPVDAPRRTQKRAPEVVHHTRGAGAETCRFTSDASPKEKGQRPEKGQRFFSLTKHRTDRQFKNWHKLTKLPATRNSRSPHTTRDWGLAVALPDASEALSLVPLARVSRVLSTPWTRPTDHEWVRALDCAGLAGYRGASLDRIGANEKNGTSLQQFREDGLSGIACAGRKCHGDSLRKLITRSGATRESSTGVFL